MAFDARVRAAIKASALWAAVAIVMAAQAESAQARDRQDSLCAPPLDAFHQAMCSNAALRPLLKAGERRMEDLVDRLSPSLRRQLIVGQRKWEAAIIDGCGAPGSSPLSPAASTTACLLEANRSRLVWLGRYTANPSDGAPAEAVETPKPADTTDGPRPPVVELPAAAPPPPVPPRPVVQPDANGTSAKTSLVMWLLEIVAVLAVLEISVRAWRSRTAAGERDCRDENQRRESDVIRGYFEEANRLRRLPECDVPVPLAPGEFGVAACRALRWKLQPLQAAADSGRWRRAPDASPGGFVSEYQQLKPVTSGMLVITNRQVVFRSEDHAFRCSHDALLKAQYDRTHLHVFSRGEPSAAVFSAERANFMALLLDGFAQQYFPDGRLPEGNTVSAQINEHGRVVLTADLATLRQADLHGISVKGAA